MVRGAGEDRVEAQLRRQSDLHREMLPAVPYRLQLALEDGGELGEHGEGEAAWVGMGEGEAAWVGVGEGEAAWVGRAMASIAIAGIAMGW